MATGEQTFRIEVEAGGDPLRAERLTRSLRDDLERLDGSSVSIVSGGADAPGSKGGEVTDLGLAVATLVAAKPFAQVLATTISEWCRRERHRKVRIVRGDAEVEITGNPDSDQQQLARELIEKIEGGA